MSWCTRRGRRPSDSRHRPRLVLAFPWLGFLYDVKYDLVKGNFPLFFQLQNLSEWFEVARERIVCVLVVLLYKRMKGSQPDVVFVFREVFTNQHFYDLNTIKQLWLCANRGHYSVTCQQSTIQHYSAPFSTIQHHSTLFGTIQHHSTPFNTVHLLNYWSRYTIQNRNSVQKSMRLTVNRMWICGKRRAWPMLSESIACDLRVNCTWFCELNYRSQL